MVICTACWGGEMVLLNGMMTCDACGEVQQDFVEEQEEFMQGIHDQGFFRKSTGHTLNRQRKKKKREPLPTRAALRAYVATMQGLLLRQARALVERFGCDPALPDVVRQLWFAYLPLSGVLEEDFATSFDDKFEPSVPLEGEEGAEPVEPSRPHTQTGSWHFYSLVMARALGPVLHHRVTLAFQMLACLVLREAVGPADVARWAADGSLPYLHYGLEAWSALGPYRRLFSKGFISPRTTPGPRRLLAMAADLACRLGVEVPPTNAAAWLERYVGELQLPQEVLPVSLELCRLYRFAPQQLALTAMPHPWAVVMSVLLVSLKLCYGLDGRRRQLPPGAPPPPDWVPWARRQLERLGGVSSFSTDEASIMSLSGAQFSGLMAYVLTAALPPHRLAHRGWRAHTQHIGSPAYQALAAAAAAQPAAVVSEAAADDEQEDRLAAAAGAGGGGRPAPRQLPAGSYAFFDRPAGKFANQATLPSEYAAVLAACAAVAWVVPHALHKLVVALEQQIINAECEVSYLHSEMEARRWDKLYEWMTIAAATEAEAGERQQQQQRRRPQDSEPLQQQQQQQQQEQQDSEPLQQQQQQERHQPGRERRRGRRQAGGLEG